MSLVDRKLCAGCGEPNLENDLCCWACGGTRFAPLNARLAGEPTVCLGEALDRTQEWERERPSWMPLLYLGGAAAFALFMCIIGFWIGRSSTPPEAAPRPLAAAPAQPVTLPTPPTALSSPAPLAPAATAFPAPSVDPPVSVRSVEATPAPVLRSPVVTPPSAVAPSTVVAGPPARSAPAPSRVTIYNYVQDNAPAAPPAAMPTVPAATGKTSVVSLRNETGGSIEVAFEGSDTRTARVAAGSVLPMVLSPGSYQVRVSGSSVASARSSAVLAEGRTYSLTVEGQKEGGSTRLVIVEPAIDGAGG